jgi:hypothetical protein
VDKIAVSTDSSHLAVAIRRFFATVDVGSKEPYDCITPTVAACADQVCDAQLRVVLASALGALLAESDEWELLVLEMVETYRLTEALAIVESIDDQYAQLGSPPESGMRVRARRAIRAAGGTA